MTLLLLQAILIGLLNGGFYGLMSSGMSLLWGIADVPNVAMITYIVLAAYFISLLSTMLGLNLVIALLINIGIFFCLGLLTHWFFVVWRKVTEHTALLLIFYGFSIALENTILIVFGADYRFITTNFTNSTISIMEYVIPAVLLMSFIISVIIFPLLQLFLRFTRLGRAIRACGEDKSAAMLMGIDVQRVDAMTSGISAILAVVAGFILSMLYPFYPTMDTLWVNVIFPTVVLGGAGSLAGTLIAGIIVGTVQSLTTTYFQSSWLTAITFGMLLIVLLVRPKGFFGHLTEG